MTDFVVVVAALSALATPMPDATPKPVPMNAPTLGFRTYPDIGLCERAIAEASAPAGTRLVCLPTEPQIGEMANAY